MTWFDQKICTLAEAQSRSELRVPGLLQRGDRAKLWITEDSAGTYRPIECYVVGLKVGFEGKFHYDLAIPLGDSGYCAVLHGIYGYVTPPQLREFDPERYTAKDITDGLVTMRRASLTEVRSMADHAAEAGVAPNWVANHRPEPEWRGVLGANGVLGPNGTPPPTLERVVIPFTAGRFFTKEIPSQSD